MTRKKGLKNPASLCYVNVCVQLLYHLPPIRNSILNLKPGKYSGIITSLRNLFSKLEAGEPTDAKNFFHSSAYEHGSIHIQDDARQFLDHILIKLDEEFKTGSLVKLNIQSPIQNSIQMTTWETKSSEFLVTANVGSMDYCIFPLQCQNSNSFEESFLNSIYSVVDHNLAPPRQPEQYIEVDKSIEFLVSPPVLMFSLNRFVQDQDTFQSSKDQRKISFEMQLNLKCFVIGGQDNEMYHLYGILAHSGNIDSGHYTLYIRNEDNENWKCFSDSQVTSVPSTEISQLFGPGISNEENSQNDQYSNVAYMLIYLKESTLPEIYPEFKIFENETDPEVTVIDKMLAEGVINQAFADFFENTQAILKMFTAEELLNLFQNGLHQFLSFPHYSYHPRDKVMPKVIPKDKDDKLRIAVLLDQIKARTVTSLLLPPVVDGPNSKSAEEIEEEFEKLKLHLPILNREETREENEFQVKAKLTEFRDKWKNKDVEPLYPGYCYICKLQKDSVRVVELERMLLVCRDCAPKIGPKPKKGLRKQAKKRVHKKRTKGNSNKKSGVSNGSFQCKFCGKTSTSASNLAQHQRICPQNDKNVRGTYKCKFCGNASNSSNHRDKHQNICPLNKNNIRGSFVCKFCSKAFNTIGHRNDHQKICVKNKNNMRGTFVCKFCGKRHNTTAEVTTHQNICVKNKNNIRGSFVCKFCGKRHNIRNSRNAHQKICVKNKSNQRGSFKCQFCGKGCNSTSEVTTHQNICVKNKNNIRGSFVCKFCGKRHNVSNSRNAHQRICPQNKSNQRGSFKCQFCGKGCNSTSDLNQHRKLCVKNKNNLRGSFKCTCCGKGYNSISDLNAHKKNCSKK